MKCIYKCFFGYTGAKRTHSFMSLSNRTTVHVIAAQKVLRTSDVISLNFCCKAGVNYRYIYKGVSTKNMKRSETILATSLYIVRCCNLYTRVMTFVPTFPNINCMVYSKLMLACCSSIILQ